MAKELNPTDEVRQIKLSLPIVQTDSYDIHCTIPSPQTRSSSTLRPVTRQRPPIDINKYIHNWNDQTTRISSLARLKCLTGPVLVNSCVNMASISTGSSSTMTDTIRIIQELCSLNQIKVILCLIARWICFHD